MNRHASTLTSKSRTHTVRQTGPFSYVVMSGESGREYTVRLAEDGSRGYCTCDWSRYRPSSTGHACGCSHVLAAFDFAQSEQGRKVYAHASEAAADRQHRPHWAIGDGLIISSRKVSA